jgi:S1-C subfamily serine protease
VAGASGEAVPGSDGQLNAGDVIHAVNGRAVRSLPDLRAAVDALKIGDAVVLQVEREAEFLYVTLRVEK